VSVDEVLLGLRVVSGVLLVGFLGAIFGMLWRDYRAAAQTVTHDGGKRGRLVVVRVQTPAPRTADGHGLLAAGQNFPLLPLTSLGRAPTNTIVLDDTFCSQEHALVVRRGGQWWLEDRRSSNGTRLNGQMVTEPVVVSSGDVIEVGRTQLKVEMD
jgi:hypothetical protein